MSSFVLILVGLFLFVLPCRSGSFFDQVNSTFCEGKTLAINDLFWEGTVTEIGNSISSLAMSGFGLYGIYTMGVFDLMTTSLYALLCVCGVGSTLYHATMMYGFGLYDSFPMSLMLSLSLMGLSDEIIFKSGIIKSRRNKKLVQLLVLPLGAFYGISILVFEATSAAPSVFRIMFALPFFPLIGFVLLIYLRDLQLRNQQSGRLKGSPESRGRARVLVLRFIFCWVVAVIGWLVDSLKCDEHPWLSYLFLHAVSWHIIAAYACLCAFAVLGYLRAPHYGYRPNISSYHIFPHVQWIKYSFKTESLSFDESKDGKKQSDSSGKSVTFRTPSKERETEGRPREESTLLRRTISSVFLTKQEDLSDIHDDIGESCKQLPGPSTKSLKAMRKISKTCRHTRPKLSRGRTKVNLAGNILHFFEENQSRLIRERCGIGNVMPTERRKAAFFTYLLMILQVSANVGYLVLCVFIPLESVFKIIGILLVAYFTFKALCVVLFYLRFPKCSPLLQRLGKCFYSLRNTRMKEPNENILICIPAYNEDSEAFERTLQSIFDCDYPNDKLYLLFIVDGNAHCAFESLMSVLAPTQPQERFETKEIWRKGRWPRKVEAGFYRPKGTPGSALPYTVLLKEENRGKRDTQWLFVEVLRYLVPNVKPPFVVFLDSDTAVRENAITLLWKQLKGHPKAAGVCGQLKLINARLPGFYWGGFWRLLQSLDRMVVVGFQFYEYHFNQIFSKQAEGAFGSVSCLPGAFSMFRVDTLVSIEAEEYSFKDEEEEEMVREITDIKLERDSISEMDPAKYAYKTAGMRRQLILNDFFSKTSTGIIQRNLYELGEDRTLTIRMLERGYQTLYEPRAKALTVSSSLMGGVS